MPTWPQALLQPNPDRTGTRGSRFAPAIGQKAPWGKIGAQAIHAALQAAHPQEALPAPRTIGRILERAGVLDGQARCRRPAPRPGWYLPRVADRQAELDSFDGVEGLVIAGGQRVEVFNAISLLGGLPGSWPHPVLRTDLVLADLTTHWRQHGLGLRPIRQRYPLPRRSSLHRCRRSGRAPVPATGSRSRLRSPAKPASKPPLKTTTVAGRPKFGTALCIAIWPSSDLARRPMSPPCAHAVLNASSAPPTRRLWPAAFRFQPTAPPQGQLIYLRRTDPTGHALVLGHRFQVDPAWPLRLVRAEVCFSPTHRLLRPAPPRILIITLSSILTLPFSRSRKALSHSA